MKYIKKFLKLIVFSIVIILFIAIIALKVYLNEKSIPNNEPVVDNILKENEEVDTKEIEKVYVDIKGAIINPGVYEIEENKKVIDVIGLAGGFTENADTSMINLAKKVTNEMVVIIYTKEEVAKATEPNQIIKYIDKKCVCPEIKNDACLNNSNTKEASSKNSSTKESSQNNIDDNTDTKINLNTATIEELQTLNGIGESKAQAIIEYREEKGIFQTIEELKEVPGIGDSLFEKIKNNITI